jgi:hypothetical protein
MQLPDYNRVSLDERYDGRIGLRIFASSKSNLLRRFLLVILLIVLRARPRVMYERGELELGMVTLLS